MSALPGRRIGSAGSPALLSGPVLLLALAPAGVLAATERELPAERTLALLGIVALLPLLTAALLRVRRIDDDRAMMGAAWCIVALGLIAIARVRPALLEQQLAWVIAAWIAFAAVLLTPGLLPALRRYRYTLLSAGLALVIATFFLGEAAGTSDIQLWLRLGPLRVQPSEILRVLLVIFLAAYLYERRGLLAESRRVGPLSIAPLEYLLPLFAVVGLGLLLFVAQRDLGPALLLFATTLVMLYLVRGRVEDLLPWLAVFALGALVATLASDHVQARLTAWIDPRSDPRGIGYQSLVALGGFAFGGVTGAGPGYGYPELIPAAHTDYPFAVIAEEWGLLGSLALVLLYALLTVRMLTYVISRAAGDFPRLLGAGLAAGLAMQVLLVFGGTLRLLPLTGLTSPLLSYGGSSMVMSWIAIALILRAGAYGIGSQTAASRG